MSIFTSSKGTAATWSEAMDKAGLNWSVSKHQFTSPITGQPVDSWGIFRDDNNGFLGSVGSVFAPIQNKAMGAHIDKIINSAGAHYETAGCLDGGKRVWALAKLPSDIRIAGTDDITKSYLLATQGHDGSTSYILKYTGIRVVCRNTLTHAINERGGDAIKTKHTTNASGRLSTAIDAAAGINASLQVVSSKLNELAVRRIDGKTIAATFDRVLGADWRDSTRTKNNAAQIANLFESNDNGAFPQIKGTAVNLYNAMTNWSDHYRTVRRTDGKEELSIEQLREESAVFGSGDAWKTKALETILELTESAPRKEIMRPVVSVPRSIDRILAAVN
jgi:phage/plasmid-like protein (TIGR03299 family)